MSWGQSSSSSSSYRRQSSTTVGTPYGGPPGYTQVNEDDDGKNSNRGSGAVAIAILICGGVLVLIAIIVIAILYGHKHHEASENHHRDNSDDSIKKMRPNDAKADNAELGWPFFARDLNGSRWAISERDISSKNAHKLKVLWSHDVGADVSSTPTLSADGFLYVCTWNKKVVCLNADTGHLVWEVYLPTLLDREDAYCRNSPAIWDDYVYVGDQKSGRVIALTRFTGDLAWVEVVDPHPFAIGTGGFVVDQYGMLFGGMASSEEGASAFIPNYVPTFRGRFFSLDALTGSLVWERYSVPEDMVGGGVWGGVTVYPEANMVFYGVGNEYALPPLVQACVDAAALTNSSTEHCRPPGDYADSIVALDRRDGTVRWVYHANGIDAWTVACIPGLGGVNPQNCPPNAGPDYDFGQNVMIDTHKIDNPKCKKHDKTILTGTIGQKSGFMWNLDLLTGELVEVAVGGPGSSLGGFEWGSAFNDEYYYGAIVNNDRKKIKLPDGRTTCSGVWVAFRKSTMKVKWMQIEPTAPVGQECNDAELVESRRTIALAPVTVANVDSDSVVFAPSMSGWMFVLDGDSGDILWKHNFNASIISGASIYKGKAYFGTGYTNLGLGTPGTKVYAISIPE